MLSTNTEIAAGVRYRLLQFVPYLAASGIVCEHRSLFDRSLEQVIYSRGHTAKKAIRLLQRATSRLRDVMTARRYDLVVVFREAFLIGPPLLEWLLHTLRCPIVFDLDDAIWEPYDSPTYGRLARWVKCAWKTDYTVRVSTAVTAGNAYIANYVGRMNQRVTILPTVVDMEVYVPADHRRQGDLPVLGWIGSHSTFQYFRPLLPMLNQLANEVAFRVRIVGAAAEVPPQRFPLENIPWTLEREVQEVRSFDIGLFPVIEDAWSRGKSAFKAIQYGAVGVPTVASPVTTNRDVVVHGETGLLAGSLDDWRQALVQLIRDSELRKRLGRAARARIESQYSLAVHAPRFRDVLLAASTSRR